MTEEQVKSESKLVFELIKDLLLLPYVIVMVLFRKKEASELFIPLKRIIAFIFEPKFTITIIALNILVYIIVNIVMFNTGTLNIQVLENYFWHSNYLFELKLQYMFSSMFLHTSLSHLLGNMLFLFILGRVVERRLGAVRTAIVYFGAGVLALVFNSLIYVFIFDTITIGLGASGAISGIGAAALLLEPLYLTYLVLGIPIPIVIVVLLQIYSDLTGMFNPLSGIGHFAHIGGYLSIIGMMFLFKKEERKDMKKGLIISLATIVLVIVIYFLLTKSKVF